MGERGTGSKWQLLALAALTALGLGTVSLPQTARATILEETDQAVGSVLSEGSLEAAEDDAADHWEAGSGALQPLQSGEGTPQVIAAPLVNHGASGETDPNQSVDPAGYSVSIPETSGGSGGSDNPYIIKFSATQPIVKHYNGNHTFGYWIGAGIEKKEDGSPQYYQTTVTKGEKVSVTGETKFKDPDSHLTKDSKYYETIYFGLENDFRSKDHYVIKRTTVGNTTTDTYFRYDLSDIMIESTGVVDLNAQNTPAVIIANLEDRSGVSAKDELYTTYTVPVTVHDSSYATVHIHATDLTYHRNGDTPQSWGYWIGAGIPKYTDNVTTAYGRGAVPATDLSKLTYYGSGQVPFNYKPNNERQTWYECFYFNKALLQADYNNKAYVVERCVDNTKGIVQYVRFDLDYTDITLRGAPIKDNNVTITASAEYTGSDIKSSFDPAVKVGNKDLTRDTDYTVGYYTNENCTEASKVDEVIAAGSYYVKITGTGNYRETVIKPVTVTAKAIADSNVTVANGTYTGSPIDPAVTVTVDSKTLVKDEDYEIEKAYLPSDTNKASVPLVEVGNYKLVIKGKGNYSGTVEKSYTIGKKAAFTTEKNLTLNKDAAGLGDDVTVSGLLPTDIGTPVTYAVGTASVKKKGTNENGTTSVTGESFTVDASGKVSASFTSGTADDVITLPITVTSSHYEDSTINIIVTLTASTVHNLSVAQSDIEFGGTLAPQYTRPANSDTPVTITYQGSPAAGGAYGPLEGPPTNVGSYTVTVAYTVNGTGTSDLYTGSTDFRITAKNIAGTNGAAIQLNSTTETYNGNPKTVNISKVMVGTSELTVDRDYQVSASSVVTATNVGTYTVTIEGIGNYTGTKSTTWEIKIVDPTVTPPTARTLTYTGADQSLINAGTVSQGAKLLYAVVSQGASAPAASSYKEDIPTAKDAGTYRVYYRVDGGTNYNSKPAAYIDATIAQKTITVKGLEAESRVYDGTRTAVLKTQSATSSYIKATLTGKLGGSTAPDAELYVTATGTYDTKAVGTNKTISISGLALAGTKAANYKLSTETTGTEANQTSITGGAITAKPVSITWDDTVLVYTGAEQAPAASVTGQDGLVSGDELAVTVAGAKTAVNATSATATPTTSYTATASALTGTDAANYQLPVASSTVATAAQKQTLTTTFRIIPREITEQMVTLSAEHFDYDGKAHAPEVAVAYTLDGTTRTLEEGTDYTVTYYSGSATIQKAAIVNPGDYRLVVEGKAPGYTGSVAASFTIGAQAQDVSVEYDGKPHTISVEAPASAVIRYRDEAGEYTLTTAPAQTRVGSLTVYYQISASGGSILGTGSATVTVYEKKLSAKWTNTEFTYDGKEHQPTLELTGVLEGEDCSARVTGARTEAGEYVASIWELTGDDRNNYEMPQDYEVSYVIKKKAAPKLTDISVNKIYTGTGLSLQINEGLPEDAGAASYEIASLTKTGAVEVSEQRVDGDGVLRASLAKGAVGDKINATLRVIMTNYEDATRKVEIVLTEKKTSSMAVAQTGIIYGATLPSPAWQAPEGVLSTSITYSGTLADGTSFATGAEEPWRAGSYKVAVQCETNDRIYAGEASFTISKRDMSDAVVVFTDGGRYPLPKEGSVKAEISYAYVRFYDTYGYHDPEYPEDDTVDVHLKLEDYTIDGRMTAAEVGTYRVTLKAADKGSFTGSCSAEWTIYEAKKDASWTAEAVASTGLIYNGQSQKLLSTLPKSDSTGTVLYSLKYSGPWSDKEPVAKDAGYYTVYYRVEETKESYAIRGEAYVEIGKKPLSLAAADVFEDKSVFPYDGKPHLPAVKSVKDGTTALKEGEDYVVRIDDSGEIPVAPGLHTITVSDHSSGNYSFIVSKEYSIQGRNISGTAASGNTLSVNTYGTKDEGLTYQWLRDGAEIAQETKDSYVVRTEDIGHVLAVRVTEGKDSTVLGPTGVVAKAAAAELAKVPESEDLEITDTEIRLKGDVSTSWPGCEFLIVEDNDVEWLDPDALAGWTDAGIFRSLKPGTWHTLYARAKETETVAAGRARSCCWVQTKAATNGYVVTGLLPSYAYTGAKIEPEVQVYQCVNHTDEDGGTWTSNRLLKKGTDYTLKYSNNVNVTNEAKLTVIGKGNYTGELQNVQFTIAAADMGSSDFFSEDIYLASNGRAQKKTPTIYQGGKKLSAKNYTLEYYALGSHAGTQTQDFSKSYTIVAKGKSPNYTGSRYIDVNIESGVVPLDKAKVALDKKSYIITDYERKAGTSSRDYVVEPVTTLSYQGVTYTEGKDYTVAYQDNRETGTGTVLLTALRAKSGGLLGTRRVSFKIEGAPIAKAEVKGIQSVPYQKLRGWLNGKQISGATQDINQIQLTLDGRVLDSDDDYKVSYLRNDRVGNATIVFTGKGNYAGTLKKTFKITKTPIKAASEVKSSDDPSVAVVSLGSDRAPYAAGGARPTVYVRQWSNAWEDTVDLKEGTDYTLVYKNNTTVGSTATVQVKGKGAYTGMTAALPFTVRQAVVADGDGSIDMAQDDVVYSAGKKVSTFLKAPTVKQGKKALKKGVDYNRDLNYYLSVDGGKSFPIAVKDKNVTLDSLASGAASLAAAGKLVVRAEIVLMGSYSGTYSTKYYIAGAKLSSVKVSVKPVTYNGSSVTFKGYSNTEMDSLFTVKAKNGATLKYGTDYEIVSGSYKNNTKVGTAKVTLRGKGSYGGTKTVSFKIVKANLEK